MWNEVFVASRLSGISMGTGRRGWLKLDDRLCGWKRSGSEIVQVGEILNAGR
jgi:hypothetical protein